MQQRVRALVAGTVSLLVALSLVTVTTPARAAGDPGWIPWAGPAGPDAEAWVRAFATSGTTVYAGTEGSGVFRSTDAGVTWAKFAGGLSGSAANIRDLEVDGGNVIAATGGGLFTSANGGAWQPLGQGVGANKLNAEVQTLWRNGSTWLAGVVGGVYRSTDSGNTWTQFGTGLPAATTVWSLDAYAYLPNRLLAATSAGAFESTDGGATWTAVSDGLPSGTNILRIMPDQLLPNRWFAITSGAGVYRSDTLGTTWKPVNTGLGANLQTRAIAQIPVGPSFRTVLGTQNGVFTSYDGGNSWAPISNTGLAGRTITWALTAMPGNPAALLAGTQGGGVHHRIMSPPVNTVPPALSDTTPTVGQTITTTNGTWVGTDEIRYSYQWQRCTTSSTGSCADIAGETGQAYTVKSADQNKFLRSIVRVTNPAAPPGYENTGAGNEPSAVSSQVAGPPVPLPGSTTRPNPSITGGFGSPTVGQALQANPSANLWNPQATLGFTYAWYRCSTISDSSCQAVGGANAASYTLVAADAGNYMRVKAVGRNSGGGAESGFSAVTSLILPQQVTPTSPPKVFGKTWTGQALTRSLGSYSGPFERNFTTWQQCDTAAGAGCTSIIGAGDTPTFIPGNGQLGKYIRVRVEIDVNGAESPPPLVVTSAAVGPVTATPAKVANTAAPRITGAAISGAVLTLNRGSWTGAPVFSQQWYRCTGAGTGCTAIAGAKALTYKLTAADVNRRILARVTGVNGWAIPVIAQSNVTGGVAAARKPTYGGGGSITGKARVGKTVTAARGSWSGLPAPTFTYQWTRNGATVAGATAPTYRVRKQDKGKRIGVRVTGRNLAGTLTVALTARRIR